MNESSMLAEGPSSIIASNNTSFLDGLSFENEGFPIGYSSFNLPEKPLDNQKVSPSNLTNDNGNIISVPTYSAAEHSILCVPSNVSVSELNSQPRLISTHSLPACDFLSTNDSRIDSKRIFL